MRNRYKMMTMVVWSLSTLLAACRFGAEPAITPTRALTGPTLAPSPTIEFQTSGDLPAVGGQNNPTVAALPNNAPLPPIERGTPEPDGAQRVNVVAEDGSTLSGDLYQSGQARVPGVLMVGADRTQWGLFPLELQSAGFSVLVMDLRPTAGTDDMQVMLSALSEVGTVDPARIGVIGAGEGADVALIGCAVDMRCDAAVLLSPQSRATLLNVLPDYEPRPLFVTASRDDAESFAVAGALTDAARGEVEFTRYDSAGRGADMLETRPDLGESIRAWLSRQLG